MIEMRGETRRALEGQPAASAMASAARGAAILALTSQAGFAAVELPDGPARIAGARSAIAGLLALLSAARGLAHVGGAAPMPQRPATPADAFVIERAAELDRQTARVEAGLQTLETGEPPAAAVKLRTHYDAVGAALSALRTMIAVALGCVFCVLSGWPGATGLLVQQAAFTALLGMQPNPAAAGVAFGLSLPLPAVVAGIVGYVLLPGVSGFVPFALAVGPCVFVFALLAHHPRTAPYAAGLMLYFALLLAPANVPSYDLASYLNSVLSQVVAVVFMVLAFRLVLPVSRERRLFRIAGAITRDLRRTLQHGRPLETAPCQSLKYDQLAQARLWLGRQTTARLAVFDRLYAFAELDLALRRAWSGLAAAEAAMPGLAALVQAARAALLQHDPAALDAAARALLAGPADPHPDLLRAASGMFGAQALLQRDARALQRYGVLDR